MKKKTIIIGLLTASLGIVSCNSNIEDKTEIQSSEQTTKTEATSESQISLEDIDKLRTEIESLDVKPIEISTANLREKIKQKWSKIHFYVVDDIVMKVKTYPYTEISKRTEEFYANKEGLKLVVIEDNGEGEKGKPKDQLDKMYYFSSGKLIKEVNNQKESEYTVKESDAEELLSEFNEYLDIYKATKK
jgi:hypothetical protein